MYFTYRFLCNQQVNATVADSVIFTQEQDESTNLFTAGSSNRWIVILHPYNIPKTPVEIDKGHEKPRVMESRDEEKYGHKC
jgi:hypothetical protein